MSATFKIDDREFQRTLKVYLQHNKRTLAEIVNQKGFAICKAATAVTVKANKQNIKSGLLADGKAGAPMAALIINKALKEGGKRGELISKAVGFPVGKGLRGSDMQAAVDALIKRRAASAAYLKSGWLPGVAIFARAIGKSPSLRAAKALQRRQFLGDADTAKPGVNPLCRFWNTAFAEIETPPNDAVGFCEQGLQQAINQEAASMKKYIERKMQQETDKLTRRILR